MRLNIQAIDERVNRLQVKNDVICMDIKDVDLVLGMGITNNQLAWMDDCVGKYFFERINWHGMICERIMDALLLILHQIQTG